MCGIVGYLGPLEPKDVILQGLKKLEYRGYDSAGVAILHDGKAKRIRASGKLSALEEKLKTEKFNGNLGIGHTRWATHGAPTERNAHPHQVGGISLVHNGIIENYQEIREELIQGGSEILSDTDSELVAHLVAREIEKTRNLYTAVENVLPRLRGAFSIVVIWDQAPDEMVAFKDGPPLVVGLGDKQSFVASDVQALLTYTKKFIYLEDREIVRVKGDKVEVFTSRGTPLTKKVVEINWNPEMVEKAGYAHFMLKEIYEQPRAVAAALEPHVNAQAHEVQLQVEGLSSAELQGLLKSTNRFAIVACGTSYYAALVAKYLIEQIAQIPVDVDIASEFRYRNPVLEPGTLFMTISQSGETADTLAALRLAKEKGLRTLSLCNVKNSSIDREAHAKFYMRSGPEIGVATTKAFTSTIAVLSCLALAWGKAKGHLKKADENEMVRALLAAPSQIEVVLNYDKYFDVAAHKLEHYRGFLYMGRGLAYPIAMEGALKMKELAYLHAEGYAAGEMKHGPLALIDHRMAIVMLCPKDQWYEKTISNLEEAKARGGQIISIGTGEDEKLRNKSEYYLSLPQTHWIVNPLLATVPLQLLSYHMASHLGYDVDQPRNLAKSVTVE
ncbi:MAG: glutamine--fructose-6-phosphate transaminase (isomerizing) [Bdellovibrionales bacterium]